MPIYEYLCSACGQRLEAWPKMSDEPLTDCAACGKQALHKLMSAPGIGTRGGRDETETSCGVGACPACLH
jgi:putative FmdB family regulatory protein